jgi:hypothetical protein
MKTKTTESGKKSVKKSATGKPTKKKQAIDKKYEPSEEEIRELAETIFYQRIERGEYGTAEEDWLKAKEYLIYSKE